MPGRPQNAEQQRAPLRENGEQIFRKGPNRMKKWWDTFDLGMTLPQMIVLLTAYVLLITDLASNPVIGRNWH